MTPGAIKDALLGRVLMLIHETEYERLEFMKDGLMVMATFGTKNGAVAAPALYCTFRADGGILMEYEPDDRIYALWSSVEIDDTNVRALVRRSSVDTPVRKTYEYVP